MPFFLPKAVAANEAWRAKLRSACCTDNGLRRAVFDACQHDILFFFNALGWLFDPRGDCVDQPFVTWPHQDTVILAIDQCIKTSLSSFGARERASDVIIEKARDQGATWILLWVYAYYMVFKKGFSGGLVTRDEATVDSNSNKGALMYKLDWALRKLPKWLLHPSAISRNVTDHVLLLKTTGSLCKGYAATGVAARGERHSVFGMDEFAFFGDGDDWSVLASTQYVTNCRIILSTYNGDSNAFFHCANDETSVAKQVLDWMDNPVHGSMQYKLVNGTPVARDAAEQPMIDLYWQDEKKMLANIGKRGFFERDGWRSPWYDSQCFRPGSTPRSIAQELDRDPRGSVGKVVPVKLLDQARAAHVRPPVWEGKIVLDDKHNLLGFNRIPGGPLKLWFEPDVLRIPPVGTYVLAADIATGVGTASNSAICGFNAKLGEQVLEYADPAIIPLELARIAVALARYLNDAYLAWEATGPTGQAFSQEIDRKLHYGNVFYRSEGKKGWWNNSADAKGLILESLGSAIAEGDFVPRSDDLLREIGEYEWELGVAVHKASKVLGVPSKSHGDRAIAAGVCWLAAKERGLDRVDKQEQPAQNSPYGTFAWRQERARKMAEKKDIYEVSDEEGNFGIANLIQSASAFRDDL